MTFIFYFCIYFVISLVVTILFSFTFALSKPLPDRRTNEEQIDSNEEHLYRRRTDLVRAEVNSMPHKST